MLYLSGKLRPDYPAMLTPRMRQRPAQGQEWAADSGRYASPHEYTDEAYLAWLGRMPASACLFATAPDVVGDAEATWAMSEPMLGPIRQLGYRVALVAQDGMERMCPRWESYDALFIGGTTRWKLGGAAEMLVAEARARGKWVHMGRVNSRERVLYANSIGCDSVDGTYLRFRPYGRPDRWIAEADATQSLWP